MIPIFYVEDVPSTKEKLGDKFSRNNTDTFYTNKDVDSFYAKLKTLLRLITNQIDFNDVIDNQIRLLNHSHVNIKNTWNIKHSYINGFMYFDKSGYSGWAEIADSEKLFNESQSIDYETALKFFNDFTEKYIRKANSKIQQYGDDFVCEEPYIFIAGQNPNDSVAVHNRIDTIQLMKDVIDAYKHTTYKVVVKIHPYEENKESYNFLYNHNNVVITEDSIHSIIKNACAVYTVNSTVGFESLLHRKRVFTAGHCDYHWVTNKLNNKYDVDASIKLLNQPLDDERIVKFVYYMLNTYFVNAYSTKDIKRKIEIAINEYNT